MWVALLFSLALAKELDVDISWLSSSSKESILSITVNGCETNYAVDNSKLDSLEKDSKAIKKLLKQAIDRANAGCKN